jgi:lipoprotein NlpI
MSPTCFLASFFSILMLATAMGQTAADLVNEAFQAEKKGRIAESLELLSRAIAKDSKLAEAYHQRGCVHFKLSKFKESVADFDKYLEMKPERKVSHWQRGISHYYAGMYEEGRQQFEGYQTFDSNDVENAVWRYMCMARADGIPKARKALLKIGPDKRVPMRQVYELFRGALKPDDVLAKAKEGKPEPELLNRQLFYAHLYVGIHYDLEGDKKKALEHLQQATENHRFGHYMWDVARVHRDLLRKEMSTK